MYFNFSELFDKAYCFSVEGVDTSTVLEVMKELRKLGVTEMGVGFGALDFVFSRFKSHKVKFLAKKYSLEIL